MTHEEAFLHAIIESPDDDVPRLVFADWLEDNGQSERAEFIRVQCELARMPEVNSRRVELDGREKALLRTHAKEWLGPLRGLVSSWRFRRGLVEAVSVRLEDAAAHADAWFGAAPIRRLTFQPVPPLEDDLGGYCRPRGDDAAVALAACTHLGRLAALDLDGNDLGDAGVAALASSPHLAGLTGLSLGHNRVGPDGARALALSPHLARLGLLDLADNRLGDAGVEGVASSPNFRRLEALGLARTGVGSQGARALAASPHLSRLRSLDLQGNAIGNKARQALSVRFAKGTCRFS